VLPAQLGDEFLDGAAPRVPYNIRDKEQFHSTTVMPRGRPASCFHAQTKSNHTTSSQPLSQPSSKKGEFDKGCDKGLKAA
jgi:hypothetical protein